MSLSKRPFTRHSVLRKWVLLFAAVGSIAVAPSEIAKMSEDFRFASAVASFGMLLRKSEYRGQATYASVRKLAAGALGEDRNSHRAEFLQMIGAAMRLAPKQ